MSYFSTYELTLDVLINKEDLDILAEIEAAFNNGTAFTHYLFGENKGQKRTGEDILDASLDDITSIGINYGILHIYFSAYGYDVPDFVRYIENNNSEWAVTALEQQWVEI